MAIYLPDIDKWDRWRERIEERIARVDVTLLDATFYGEGELRGRLAPPRRDDGPRGAAIRRSNWCP